VRLSISTHSGAYNLYDIAFWLALLVGLEVGTDWIKFCLIMKFSELPASILDIYKEVLMADILLCRSRCAPGTGASPGNTSHLAWATRDKKPPPVVPFRGIHSFSHTLQRRLGFSGVPMTTIVLVHFLLIAHSPCSVVLQWPRATNVLVVVGGFIVVLLAKILLGIIVFGFAVRRRSRIPRGLELFPNIRSL